MSTQNSSAAASDVFSGPPIGPLGYGIATAVGIAMEERHLAAKHNRDAYNVVDHYTYALCGDGDLMEGVSAEASSLGALLNIGRLGVLYN